MHGQGMAELSCSEAERILERGADGRCKLAKDEIVARGQNGRVKVPIGCVVGFEIVRLERRPHIEERALDPREISRRRALRGEPFILFSHAASPTYHDRILSICADDGFRPEVRHEARHWLAIVALVAQGLGVALVPKSLERSLLLALVVAGLLGLLCGVVLAHYVARRIGTWRTASG